jgi:hypothetical protein
VLAATLMAHGSAPLQRHSTAPGAFFFGNKPAASVLSYQ